MDVSNRVSATYSEASVQHAAAAYLSGQYTTIQAAADAFSIPRRTLSYRLTGRSSRSHPHESRQILTYAEEKILVRWITQLTRTAYSPPPVLVIQMAENLRSQRIQLKPSARSQRPIGKHWLDRFRKPYPEIQGVWLRQIESARENATNVDTVKRRFDAVTQLWIKQKYKAEDVYNMD